MANRFIRTSAYDAYKPFALSSGGGTRRRRFVSDVEPVTPRRPFIDTGENPEAQGAFGGMTARDMARSQFETGLFEAENIFGRQRFSPEPNLPLPQRATGLVVPGTGTQPVAVDPFGTPLQSPARTRVPGQRVFTSEPSGPPKTIVSWVNAAGNAVTQLTIDVAYQDYLDSPSAGDTPLSKDVWATRKGYTRQAIDNPDYKKAFTENTTGEQRRAFTEGKSPAALTKQEKPTRATTTLEDPAAHGYQGWPQGYAVKVERDEEGNVLRVSEPTPPPVDFQAREEAERIADLQKSAAKDFAAFSKARQEGEAARKEAERAYTLQQAASGGVAALNAGAAGAPLTRTFGESTAGVPNTTFFGRAPGAGFNPNAPAGSQANPYGAQGPFRSNAEVINERAGIAESARLRNAGRISQAVDKVINDAASGMLARTPPAVRQSILAILQRAAQEGQTDVEGGSPDYARAIQALQGTFAAERPRGQVFTRYAGAV